MPAPTSRTPRGERSRERILEVASRLMGEKGYDGTSVATVSAAAGVPKSLVFHYFGSKPALLSAVMTQGAHRFFDAMRTAQAEPPSGGSHQERMGWYLRTTAEVFASHHDFHRLHTILMMTSDEGSEELESVRRIRAEGRLHMRTMVLSAFADLEPDVAAAVADELEAFGLVGIDGGYISERGDGEPLAGKIDRLTTAMVAIGEATAAAHAPA